MEAEKQESEKLEIHQGARNSCSSYRVSAGCLYRLIFANEFAAPVHKGERNEQPKMSLVEMC